MRSPRCHATVKAKRSQVNGMTRNKLGGGGLPFLRETGCLETARYDGTGKRALFGFGVFGCLLTVSLGMGGRPEGLLVSVSSLRMWSVLMYES